MVYLACGMLVAVSCNIESTVAAAERDGAATVQALLTDHCLTCHGDTEPAGDLRLDLLKPGAMAADGELWLRVLEQLATGNMPPKEEPQPSRAKLAEAVQTIHASLHNAGLAEELAFPDKGNHVPHELLFGPLNDRLPPPSSPARLWRLSPSQYDALALRVGGRSYRYERTFVAKAGTLPTPFSMHGGPGLQDYSALYRIDEAQTEQMVLNAREVARRIFARESGFRPSRAIGEFAEQQSLSEEDRAAVVKLCSQLVFKQDPSKQQSARYTAFLGRELDRAGVRAGMQGLLAAMLLHPSAVYRMEPANGPTDEHGRARLPAATLATALAFALTDHPPDKKLLKAVESGKFETRSDLRREAERMLQAILFSSETRPSLKPLHRFFQEYFGYVAAPDVFKDDELLLPQQRMYLVRDTDRLIYLILQEDRQVLRELLTTNRSYVMSDLMAKPPKGRSNNKKGGTHLFGSRGRVNEPYNVLQKDWTANQPMRFPKNQRVGILMQPSWLIAHSQNGVNDAIRRGKWIRERLLGGAIPDTPIRVDAQLPDEPQKPLRERMRVTRAAYCWKCHERMDPLGFAFETFDDWGRFRTEEFGQPVDAQGAVLGAGDKALNGPLDGPVELVTRLAHSDYVEQVFVRHAFRYWMGRNETPRDAPVLQDAWRAYHDNNGSMKELLLSLLTSDSFLYRHAIAETPAKNTSNATP